MIHLRKNISAVIFFVIILVFPNISYSETIEEIDSRAEKYYENKEFSKALGEWLRALSIDPNNEKIQAKIELLYEEKRKKDIATQKAKNLYRQAKAELEKENFEEAQRKAELAVENYITAYRIDPNDPVLQDYKNRMRKLQEETESRLKIKQLAEKNKKIYDEATALALEAMKEGKYETAIEQWNIVLGIAPEDINASEGKRKSELAIKNRLKFEKIKAILEQGKVFYAKEQYEESLNEFKQVLLIDPMNDEASEYAGKISDILEERKSKEQKLAQAEQFYNSGIDNLNNYRFNEARDELSSVLAIVPDFKDTKARLESIDRLEKEFREKKRLENLSIINEEFQIGLLNYTRGNYPSALSSFEKIIKMDPENERVKKYIEMVKEALHQEKEEVVDEDSPYYDIVSSLIISGKELYEKGQYSDSLQQWERILKLFPKNKIATEYMLKCYLKQNPEIFKKLSDRELERARALAAKGNGKEAMKIYELIKSIDPNYPGLETLYSAITTTAKQKTPSGTPQETPVSRDEIDRRYATAISTYQNGGKDNARKALDELRFLERKDPENVKVLSSINKIESELRLSEDKTVVREKKKLTPEQDLLVKKYYYSGIGYYSNNRFPEAIAEWRKVLAIDPDNEKAKSNIRKCLALMKQ